MKEKSRVIYLWNFPEKKKIQFWNPSSSVSVSLIPCSYFFYTYWVHWVVFPFSSLSVAGDNGRLEYSIVSGDDEEIFTINPSNGTLSNLKHLDRETKSSYNLVVMATDMAKPPQKRLSSTTQVRKFSDIFLVPDRKRVREMLPLLLFRVRVKFSRF